MKVGDKVQLKYDSKWNWSDCGIITRHIQHGVWEIKLETGETVQQIESFMVLVEAA